MPSSLESDNGIMKTVYWSLRLNNLQPPLGPHFLEPPVYSKHSHCRALDNNVQRNDKIDLIPMLVYLSYAFSF